MRRIAGMLGLLALLLPVAAWADPIFLNRFGTVTITSSGIVSQGSQLVSYDGITAPHGHALGSVSFSTGVLTKGSIWSGGTFAGGKGSSFLVTGVGAWARTLTGCASCSNPITLFSASFVGPIQWKLVSHTGKYNYVFTLEGVVAGQLFNGRSTRGLTKQTIYVYQNQWFQDHGGGIRSGSTDFRLNLPEPGTLGLFCTGLIVLGGAVRRRLLNSQLLSLPGRWTAAPHSFSRSR